MDEAFLYQKIAASIRQEILAGRLQPGGRLPPIRQMAGQWGCTIGTIQHAYQELARQGLVISRAGQGTRVVEEPPVSPQDTPLRRASLVNRAEAFLLETLGDGYRLDEVERAVRMATDRWRAAEETGQPPPEQALRFSGSHDLAVSWIAAHFPEIVPGYSLQTSFSGSLGGMIALAEGRADLAGSHLWDAQSNDYNLPFVSRVLPGKKIALVTLARRRLGMILPPGNPAKVGRLQDLNRPGLRFVNRQPGSGTRVWLDASLSRLGLQTSQIQGYENERRTHSEIARAVASGEAEVGVGLEASARAYGLDFILLVRERYDLVIPASVFEQAAVQSMVSWLQSQAAKQVIESLGGYEAEQTGRIQRVG